MCQKINLGSYALLNYFVTAGFGPGRRSSPSSSLLWNTVSLAQTASNISKFRLNSQVHPSFNFKDPITH